MAPIVDRPVSKGECSGRLEGAFCSVPWDVEAAICKRPGRCRRRDGEGTARSFSSDGLAETEHWEDVKGVEVLRTRGAAGGSALSSSTSSAFGLTASSSGPN